MTKRKNISIGLTASFGLLLTLSYWLQSQIIPVSVFSLDNFKIEVPHTTSAVLSLVRESLEDSENRRTGLNSESQLTEQFHCSTLQIKKGFLYLELFQAGLFQSDLYLAHRQLLI